MRHTVPWTLGAILKTLIIRPLTVNFMFNFFMRHMVLLLLLDTDSAAEVLSPDPRRHLA